MHKASEQSKVNCPVKSFLNREILVPTGFFLALKLRGVKMICHAKKVYGMIVDAAFGDEDAYKYECCTREEKE